MARRYEGDRGPGGAAYVPEWIYNRFNRWSHRGLWTRLFATLSARAELPDDLSIDSTAVRAHRPMLSEKGAHGGTEGPRQRKGRRKFRPSGAHVVIKPPKSMR